MKNKVQLPNISLGNLYINSIFGWIGLGLVSLVFYSKKVVATSSTIVIVFLVDVTLSSKKGRTSTINIGRREREWDKRLEKQEVAQLDELNLTTYMGPKLFILWIDQIYVDTQFW